MNAQKPPRMSELLASVATTISVQTKAIGLWRVDKAASKQSDMAHNAQAGAGKTSASRLAGCEDRVKELTAKGVEMQEMAKGYTTAWGDRRLLPNANLDNFLKDWTKSKKEYDEIHQKLVADAPDLIAKAQANKGTYNVDAVTEEEIRTGFKVEFKMEAIADTETFKATGLSKQMEDALKRRLEAEVQAAYQLSQKDALERVAEPVKRMCERLQAYSQREDDKDAGRAYDKSGTFRNSLTKNVEEIANVFRSFNLTGDRNLNAIADQLDALTGIEADDLRNNRKLREDTAARAKAILEGIGVYQGEQA